MPHDAITALPLRPLARAAAIVAGVILLAGCGAGRSDPEHDEPKPLSAAVGQTQRIGSENLAYMWPLKVDHGNIQCRNDGEALFITPAGKQYALNDKAEDAQLPSIDPLRADGSLGSKVSLGGLLSHALSLCEQG